MTTIQTQAMAVGLLFQCPMGFCLETCVFQEIREKLQNGNNIFNIVKDIPPQELDNMVESHRACLERRER